ncbi:MAG: hypothetical protein ABSG15_15020 [FCB group bacterium]|jgi:hypothetical protein
MVKNPEILEKFELAQIKEHKYSIPEKIAIFNDMNLLYEKLRQMGKVKPSHLNRWNINFKRQLNDADRIIKENGRTA